MKKFYLFLMAFLCLSTVAMADSDPICNYAIRMSDAAGDGWDGDAKLTVTDGSHIMDFKLETGSFGEYTIPYYGGDTDGKVYFTWTTGSYDDEIGITILAPSGKVLFNHNSGDAFSVALWTMASSPCFTGTDANAPQNVTAEVLESRKLKVSWGEVTGAAKYRLTIIDPEGVPIRLNIPTTASEFTTTNVIYNSGDYTIFVASMDGSDNVLAETRKVVSLEVPKITSVTVGALIPTDCGMDVSEGAWLCWFERKYGKQHVVPMTAKGGQRFEAIFNPNATRYGFYIMNKPELTAEGVHVTSERYDQTATEYCVEVEYSTYYYHNLDEASCDAVDHDCRPFNLVATPLSGDSVLFEWEVVTKATYGYDLYVEWGNGMNGKWLATVPAGTENKISYKTSLNYAEPTEFTWYVEYEDNNGYDRRASGNPFTTTGANNYIPVVTVHGNGDNTFTINWSVPSSPDHFVVSVGSSTSTVAGNIRSYTTSALVSNDYYAYVTSYDEHNNELGYGYAYFRNNTMASKNYTLHVYIPENAGVTPVDKYVLLWSYQGWDNKTLVDLISDGNNWYHATLTGLTINRIDIRFLNASAEASATVNLYYSGLGVSSGTENYFIVNKNKTGERFFATIASGYNTYDYTPTSVSAQAGDGKVTISWEVTDDAPQYRVELRDLQNRFVSSKTVAGSPATLVVSRDTAVTGIYSVTPYFTNYSYSNNTAAYGAEPVTVQPSKFLPTNVQATQNPDGTYTISWSAPADRHVTSYYLDVNDPDGNTLYSDNVGDVLSYNVGLCIIPGVYEISVEAMDDNMYGYGYSSFMVEGVDPHDVTARVLFHPDSEFDLSGDVDFMFYDYTNGGAWKTVKATREGTSQWFAATFKTITPSVEFRLNSSTDSYPIMSSACFEYNKDANAIEYVNPVSCDALPHDYRITYGSLTANAVAGRVDMSWSAETVADEYEIMIYNSSNIVINYFYVEGDTKYAYMVPDGMDGEKITWSVQPITPYAYAAEKYTTPITLAKSTVTMSNLQITTTDSLSIDCSWTCSSSPMDFAIRVYGNGGLQKLDTVIGATTYHYVLPNASGYYFWVQPLDPTTHDALANWKYSSWLYLGSAPIADPVTNVHGEGEGRTLTFTWETSAPQVYAEISRFSETDQDFSIWKTDSFLTANTWVYEAEIQGLYRISVRPMIEVAPGHFEKFDKTYYATATAFDGKTYKVDISATEGGEVWPNDLAGNYPDGFEIEVSTWPSSADYAFEGWSDGSMETTRTFTLHNDLIITANYKLLPKHTISLTAGEHGTLRIYDYFYGTPWGDEYPTFTKTYPEYEYSVLEADAIPETGYSFYQWSDGSFDNPYVYESKEDVTLTAIFKQNCTLTIPNTLGGSVTVIGFTSVEDQSVQKVYTVAYGCKVILKAVPGANKRFAGWSNGVNTLMQEITVTENLTISASFEDAGSTPTHSITLGTEGTDGKGSGTLNGYANGDYTLYEGDQIQLIAVPSVGSHFVKWSDNNSTDSIRTYTVGTSDATIKAIFAINKYSLLVTITGGSGTISGSANGMYEHGATISLTAAPAEHYHFAGWSNGSTSLTYSFSIYRDITLQAIFEVDKYSITFLNEDSTFIETKLWGYDSTPECSVTPAKAKTPQYTYSFAGWDPEIVKVTKDATYVATFSQSLRKYTVKFVDWDDTVLDTQKVAYGKAAEAPADPKRDGYTFTGWDKEFTNITADLTVKALYSQNQGVENVESDAPQCTKVLIDGRVYILRGERLYTVQGQLVNDK